ncbi:hypothetical protein OPT61_g8686 [Boeremia exigua]|uniref:Uncharacterized protein n=1 Tax=Boeremia exigua TaxID=749465 RepID=A0ACC2HX78_9PLEO|nr:hypothetical protein OPT61_g8686 [Boeremia exigua]
MAPMVRLGTRPVPSALRAAAGRGEGTRRPSIRALQSRCIATNAAVHERGVEFPGNGIPPVQTPSRQAARERIQAIESAKPFSEFLTDNYRRQHDYLRISITERCNLRCLYCMPEEGIPLSPPANMLTTPEIFYLSSLFVSQGVTKIRLTGGEPTVRRDIVPLMQQIGSLRPKGLRELALTTNGISLHRKLDAMVEAGLTGINLSLDTLDPFQFQIMTRRKGFDAVMKSIDRILEMNKLGANVKLKVNCVVMRGLNEREILPFVEMGREKDIEVRFIEYMPFGGNKWSENKMISFQEMVDIIRTKYPGLARIPGHKNDTSKTFQVPGFVGKVGFITSMTNDFCSTCNRLRITSDGNLKVCLHGNDEVSLRDLLRKDNDNAPIDEAAFERIKQLEMDRASGRLSDSTALGWGPRERELLSVIGQAVKRKAEKHADMGDLATMQNRPMILIDQHQRRTSRRLRPMPSASSVLAANAHLNPLLGSSLGFIRAFSTGGPRRTEARAADSEMGSRLEASVPHIQQEDQAISNLPPRVDQSIQKTQLLRELRSNTLSDTNESEAQPATAAYEHLTPEAVVTLVADLETRLAALEAVDWGELTKFAREESSLKEQADYKNLNKNQRAQRQRVLQAQFQARVVEMRQQKAENKKLMSQLQESIAKLKTCIGSCSTQDRILDDTKKRRREELLRKRDEIAVKMAKLRAATPPRNGDELAPIDPRSLRLHLPEGRLKIDNSLTIDINLPTENIRQQVEAMRERLRAFHPPLDELPLNIEPKGKGPGRQQAYMYKTWLKILVSRYQAKTGVYGEPVEDNEKWMKELSEEAKERMARRWNDSFGEKRGVLMPVNETQQDLNKATRQVTEQTKQEDDNELGPKAKASCASMPTNPQH